MALRYCARRDLLAFFRTGTHSTWSAVGVLDFIATTILPTTPPCQAARLTAVHPFCGPPNGPIHLERGESHRFRRRLAQGCSVRIYNIVYWAAQAGWPCITYIRRL